MRLNKINSAVKIAYAAADGRFLNCEVAAQVQDMLILV